MPEDLSIEEREELLNIRRRKKELIDDIEVINFLSSKDAKDYFGTVKVLAICYRVLRIIINYKLLVKISKVTLNLNLAISGTCVST